MKKLEDWAAVHRVYSQTKSKHATAKFLGISRNTVKKLLDMDHEPFYQRRIYSSKIDPFKEQIITWRCKPFEFNGTRIYRELKKLGYTGSINPVYRFLRRIDGDEDGQISSKATVRHESPPGDQAQFDWSPYVVKIGDTRKNVICFSLILAASRKMSICFSYREDADSIYEAVQELFEDLGGVTLEMLVDNPKALVIENNPKAQSEIIYNPHAMLLAKHMGFELNACPCYWPRKKGKVERPFEFIYEQFIKGSSFATMEELNRRGKEFINEHCNEVHSTTERIPNEHYLQDEKHTLLPLPKERYRMNDLIRRKVSNDSLVSIDGSKYSVPVQYVGKWVYFRIVYGFRIEIYDKTQKKLILTVEKAEKKHTIIKDDMHYDAIAKGVPTSLPQIRREFTARFINGKRFLEAAEKRINQPTRVARDILKLQELYDDEVLDGFIDMAIDTENFSTKAFKMMIKEYHSVDSPAGAPIEADTPLISVNDLDLVRDLSYYEDSIKEVRA